MRWRTIGLVSLLTLILLCCAGVVADRAYLEPYRRRHRLVAEIEALNGTAVGGRVSTDWMEKLLGEEYFIEVNYINLGNAPIDDTWLVRLKEAPTLRFLDLHGTKVGDAGLVHVAGVLPLQELRLDGTAVTDAGLASVRHLTKLKTLRLGQTAVTDKGLAQLQGLSQLNWLELQGCQISDAGVSHLAGLQNLEMLDLTDTGVTDACMAQLASLKRLSNLFLENTDVTEAALMHLRQLPSLRVVGVSGTQILPAVLWHALPGLESPLAISLDDPTEIHVENMAIGKVTEYLEERHRVDFCFDTRRLPMGVGRDTPVTLNVRNKPLSAALREVLQPHGLTFVPGREVFWITGAENRVEELPRLVLGSGEKLSRKLSTALNDRVEIEYKDQSLSLVRQDFSTNHGIEIFLDKDIPLIKNWSRVNCSFRSVAAATALELILHELDMHGVIEKKILYTSISDPGQASSNGSSNLRPRDLCFIS